MEMNGEFVIWRVRMVTDRDGDLEPTYSRHGWRSSYCLPCLSYGWVRGSHRNSQQETLGLSRFFTTLSSIGRLDGVSLLDARPRSPSLHEADARNLVFVVTGGTLSAQTLIALHGEARDWRRGIQPVSVVSFLHFCDPPRGVGKLMGSALGLFQQSPRFNIATG